MRPTNSLRTRGKTSPPHRDPRNPPRRRAKKRQGHGTSANERPPIISVVSRETDEQRLWVCDHADTRTCRRLMADNVPASSAHLYADEWQRERSSHPCHATVRHGMHEWARDNDRDGGRAVHWNPCEGAGAGLRTYLRAFRGVHQQDLHLSVATYAAMVHTQCVTPS